MCGISGIVGNYNVARDLFSSIRNLEYRGYDSCGMAVIYHETIHIRKNTGGVDEVNKKENLVRMQGHLGIAHTRWATHGGVTRFNSHPHASKDLDFAIVHNGIFSNYKELKAMLQEKGYEFQSQTDSEVFVQLLYEHYKHLQNVESAFLATLKEVQGSFAIAMVSVHKPNHIFCAKQDSPLILGLGNGVNYVGSDINAFLEFTRIMITLDDGEYAILSCDQHVVKKVDTGQECQKKHLTIDWDTETTKKGGYSHYMLKEIFDQPHTIQQVLKIGGDEIKQLAATLHQAKTGYFIGVGTTFYVTMVGQYFFSKLAQRFFPTISSDEFLEVAVVDEHDAVLAVSQSGETFDTKMAINYAKKHGAKTSAIVNVMGSSISLMVDQVIMQGSGPEICVVSTKAALAQMIVLLRCAVEYAKIAGNLDAAEYEEIYRHLNSLPEVIQTTLNEKSGFIRNIVRKKSQVNNWLFLGCGIYYPVALESALKMKEVTYLHAEGMAAGFLKHGTLAMIDPNFHCLFFIPNPEEESLHNRTLVAIEEISARGGQVLGFHAENDDKAAQMLQHSVALPVTHPLLSPFMQMIMAQLFSYYTALELNRNIDKPRNLAKSVTVG